MCGILCMFGNNLPLVVPRDTLKHRGPDETRTHKVGKCYMEFTRLAINDLSSEGSQPFVDFEKVLMCNGEIYNFREFDQVSKNDCAFLLKMIDDIGIFETSKNSEVILSSCTPTGNRSKYPVIISEFGHYSILCTTVV